MGRIGLMVPSSNTTVEPEFYRALPRSVTLHTARLYLTRIAPESILRVVEDMESQAKLLASADVDVIVLGATRRACSTASGTTASSSQRSKRQPAAKRPPRRPRSLKPSGIAKAFLQASGVEVVGMKGLALIDNLVVGRLSPDTAYDLALEVATPEAEGIVLSCTNWQTMDAIERIEKKLGKPVVSTTQASIWAALDAIGHSEPVQGYGRLLRELKRLPA